MIVTIFARVVARLFGARGIYDQILQLKGLPFLEEMPPEFIVNNSSLRARDIMSQTAVTLHPEMKISALIDILRGVGGANYEYQVASPLHDEALIGTIRKSHVLYLLQHKQIFYTLNESDEHSTTTNNSRPGKALKYDVLLKDDPSAPCLDRIEQHLNQDDLDKYVDLSPYLQIAPHAVDGHCSAERAYESFRMIGLRSLLVLGPNYKPIGVITRSDLFILEDSSIEEDMGPNRHDGSIAQYGVVS
jgi:CBS domain-containing protein